MRLLKWRYTRRAGYTLIVIAVVLVLVRLALPYGLLWYVNRTLDKLPDYHGHVADSDLSLWRGAYQIDGMAKAYLPITIQGGRMNLITVLDAHDGHLDGYVKPLLKNLDIFSLKDSKNPFHLIKQAAAAGTVQILKNHSEDQFATHIPISGDLKNPDVGILPLVLNVLKNGFAQAFKPTYDAAVGDNKSDDEDDKSSKDKSLLDKAWPF